MPLPPSKPTPWPGLLIIQCDKPVKQPLKSGHKDKHLINCIDNDDRHKEFELPLRLSTHMRIFYATQPLSPLLLYGFLCYKAERITRYAIKKIIQA